MTIDRQRNAAAWDRVHAALVADLANSTVPTTIMGCTLVGIAAFAYGSTQMGTLLAATVVGGLASLAKVVLVQFQKRRTGRETGKPSETVRWERAHAAITGLVAASVGLTATSIFLQPEPGLQMLATGLIFGYGSGIVSRVGIRPKIAVPALLVASAPPIAAAALWNDTPHLVLATVFTVFLLGSFDSVRHVHRTAVKHVRMRLEMAALAETDPLTGLANRSGLRAAFAAIAAEDPVAVLCLDLDGFKGVNDRYGHAAGDALLQLVAERLLAVTAPDTTVVRMGGDEFVVLMPGLHGRDEVADLARRIAIGLREPFALRGEEIRIGASIGHASSPAKPADLDGLLARADEAAYRTKSRRGTGLPAGRTPSVLAEGV